MNAQKNEKAKVRKETVVGTFKQTRELLPNGLTKETREETTVTLRRESPDPLDRR